MPMRLPFHLKDIRPAQLARKAYDALTYGWYVKGEEQSGNRRRLLLFVYSANICANLIGANFFTGLLLYMGADDAFIGFMSMIGVATNMLQLFAPLLLERFARRKKLLISLRAVILFLNVVFIGVVPLFPAPVQLQLTLIALAVIIVNLLNAMIAPGVTVWHIQFVPNNIRAAFFSLQSMTNSVVVAVFTLAGSTLVDAFKSGDMELAGLIALRGVALIFAFFDLYLLSRMKEYEYPQEGGKNRVTDLIIKPFRERLYLKTVAIAFLWSFTANIAGPYYTVYLLNNLKVSYSFITTMAMINIPAVLFLTPVWRKFLHRVTWFQMLMFAMGAYLLHYVMLALVTPGTMILYPIALVWAYAMAPGINLAFANIPYINIPEKNQTVFIGFYSTIANLGAFLGVSLGRQFISMTDGVALNILGIQMINKQLIMLLVAALMLIAVLAIYRLQRGIKTA